MTDRGENILLRYLWLGRSGLFYVLLASVLLASFLAAHYSQSVYRSCSIEFVIETEEPVNFDIYYDVGRGFNEVDHQSMQVEELGVPTTISFCIPVWAELNKIRFDPAKKHVKMILHSITIFYGEEISFRVPLNTLEPMNQIIDYNFDGKLYTFETDPEGDDPMFVLNKISDSPVFSRWKDPLRYVIWMTAGLFSFFFGRFIFRYFFLGL